MKKIISIIIVITIILFPASCKSNYEYDEGYTIDDSVGNESENILTSDKNTTVDLDNSNREQIETSDDILQEQQPQPDTEDEVETSEVTEPPQQNGVNMYVTDDHPTDVYFDEYLPYKLGYVDKITNDDGTFYYSAVRNQFTTKQPITEQMVEAATKYPYLSGEYNPDYYTLHSIIDGVDSLEQLEQNLNDSSVIVKGHFEQNHGTAYGYYEKITTSSPINFNTTEFTLYNFVIEKVYTEDSEYKAGDIVEIGLDGTVLQGVDGYYRSTSAEGLYYYMNFSNATLEERTYVISFFNDGNKFGINRIGLIRQNVYEQIPADSDNQIYKIAYEIQQKYN